ncbi:tRNA preQ1(34) S-adenosylmethionine ribosyltransferase-isomerase QueA [Ampullimonas aquatilis]|uniref:tRNA preQ1(34) S-adenosylmethionine ribosyltransferase-isomerase QueA n=1 Tax=Ampullimonas aquatilis TaxID=1341549 RepID=UPI003C713947
MNPILNSPVPNLANTLSKTYTLDDFDFTLPPELIAQDALPDRAASRLLLVQPDGLVDAQFTAVLDQLNAGDVLVFNDTKVLKARLFGVKPSGGKVEVLIERVLNERRVLAMLKASHKPAAGSSLRLADAFDVTVAGREGEFFVLDFPANTYELLEAHGRLPLPPYITHIPTAEDEQRYQTVYAQHPGAVAAPTAGLHFTPALLDAAKAKGVHLCGLTLHVGAGTFQPVRAQNLAEHHMHSEWYDIPAATVAAIAQAKVAGRQVVAVGTTSLRALEAASQDGTLKAGAAETSIFITPGYRFHTVDRLITNFHLPKSTLLMLVSAFAGYDTMRAVYAHAIAERYRFFSYGDAMLLSCASKANC